MKKRFSVKRVLVIAILIIALVMVGIAVFDRLYYPRPRQQRFVAMLPSTPMVYLQCVRLSLRVQRFTNSPEYATFLQSEFFTQIEQTDWWAVFREEFDAFWKSLIIDPMRIIGTDMAIAVYETEIGELIPRVILIGQVDQIAKIAERVVYGYDKATGTIGLSFEQRYYRASVYSINQPGMLCPLYYAILGNVGMISTSLPLLQSTIQTAMGESAETGAAEEQSSEHLALLRTAVYETPEQRFVAGYVEPSRLIQEFRRNLLLRQLGWFQGREWQQTDSFPQITLQLDSFPDRLTLRTGWAAGLEQLVSSGTNSDTQPDNDDPAFRVRSDDPLVAVRYKQNFLRFARIWQQFFPQWRWESPIRMPAYGQDIFGEVMECKLSDKLLGTFYTVPDIACILDTQQPERAGPVVHRTITGLIDQMVSPIAQRAITTSTEMYRRTGIAKFQFMLQDVLCYGVVKHGEEQEQQTYTLLAAQGNVIKRQIDSLQASGEPAPYILPTPPRMPPAFVVLLNNKALSAVIQKFSETNTFALLYPRHSYPELYQALPFLIQALQPIPPVIIEGDTQGGDEEMYLNVSLSVKRET